MKKFEIFIGATAILGMIAVTPARAALDSDNPFCIPETQATNQLQSFQDSHPNISVDMLEGEDAKDWVSTFNKAPPISNYKAEKILVIADKNSTLLRIALIAEGKMCMTTVLDQSEFIQILEMSKANKL